MKKYYIQSGSSGYKDIFTEFGIYVSKTEGMSSLPDSKSKFDTAIDTDQGSLVSVPNNIFFKKKTVVVTLLAIKGDVKKSVSDFLEYAMSSGDLSYFDTYRGNGFRGYYIKSEIINEKYRDDGDFVEFSLSFEVPNGICYGYDNIGNSEINIEVTKGYVDLYFSDGTELLNQVGIVSKTQTDGFVIICPSINDNVNIS